MLQQLLVSGFLCGCLGPAAIPARFSDLNNELQMKKTHMSLGS